MISFHLHGTIELRAADGRPLLSVLSQPKRTALLAYLVIADPGRFHRRDTLLGIFWPELDERRARNSLSQALHYLRRSLGPGVVVSRGEGEVGIADGAIWCDSVAFEEAVRGGRPEEALEYCRGELLAGLNLDGVPEFERWLDLVRARKREQASALAWSLAEGAAAVGDLEGAAAHARSAAALQEGDESALRRLLRYLDRAGDRAGALHAYEEFARHLERGFEAEPSGATVELIEEIRRRPGVVGDDRGEAPSAAEVPAVVGSAGSVSLAPPAGEAGVVGAGAGAARGTAASLEPQDPVAVEVSGAPEMVGSTGMVDREEMSGGGARGSLRRWSWPGLVALLAILVVVSVQSAPPGRRTGAATGTVSGELRAVVVFPFEVQGATDLSYLGRGMTDLLSPKFDGVGNLRSVDPRAVLATIGGWSAPVHDLSEAGGIAGILGADLFILGSLTAHGESVQLSASLYERGLEAPLTRTAVEGRADQIFDLVDRLAAELLAEQHRGSGQKLVRLAAATTGSLPALKAYLKGEDALRAGHYALAVESFREAAAIDTAFALAYYRLAVAAVWGGQGSQLSIQAVEQALRYGDRLSGHGRNLLLAFRAYLRRDAVEAERHYRTVLASHPGDLEAWYHLGEVLFHYRPLLGSPVEESATAFERVLHLEPDHGESLIHLARIAARRGDRVALDSLVARLIESSPSRDRYLELQVLQAAARRDPDEWARIVDSTNLLGESTVLTLLFAMVAHGGDLEAALELAHRLTHPSNDRLYRGVGYGMAAQIELARGRWARARSELDELARIEPGSALIIAALFAAAPFAPVEADEVENLRGRLAGLDGGDGPGSLRSLALSPQYLPFLRHYLAGLLSARLGDRVGAAESGRALERLGGTGGDPGLGPGLARSINAGLAWRNADLEATLGELEEVPLEPYRLKAALGYAAQGYERFLFGETLAAAGREEEALRWYGSFPEPAGYDLIYLAPSHLRRAEIHERRGEHQQAIFHYQRFIELWAECDPELRPIVAEARGRLDTLYLSDNRGGLRYERSSPGTERR